MKPTTTYQIAAWILSACALVAVLVAHLLPSLLAGLLVYALVGMMTPLIVRHFAQASYRARMFAVGIVVFIVVGLLGLAGFGLVAFLRSDTAGLTLLLAKMAEIVADTRTVLPATLLQYLPADAIAFEQFIISWLQSHAGALQGLGKEAIRSTAHIIIGMVLGGMLALHEAGISKKARPLAEALTERAVLLEQAFRNIVFAQLRIAAINATVTGIYLAVILPLFDIHLPLVKTMVAITFVVGLIPVLGNLISNTVIVIVSLSTSFAVALSSLAFLVIVHKLEYFLNARIVGGQIQARAWELLISMLLMEALFGISGIVAAPIYYAYLKSELRASNLV